MNKSMRNNWLGGLTACLLWLSQPAWAESNTIEDLKVSQGQADSQVLKVTFKESLTATPAAFMTSNPNRLVIDLPGTASALGRHAEQVDKGNIRNVQVMQAGERSRLVVNLSGPTEYELKTDRNYLLVSLRGGQAGSDPATRFAETSSARSHSIRDIDFRRGKSGEGKLTVTLSDPGIGIDLKQQGRTIQVDFLNTDLPTALKRRLDVSDFATAAQTIEAYPLDGKTRLIVTPSGKVSHSAYQTGNQFVIEISPQQVDFSNSGRGGQYTGERISLDFQNVEVKDLLKVIADFTGQNIVTSDRVTGTTSLRLKEVPWDQALDIILATKGLSRKIISNNVLWVAPSDEIAQVEKRDLEAKQQIYDLEELQSEVVRLNYLRADEAQAILNGQSLGASAGGTAVSCGTSAAGVTPTAAAAAAAGGAAGQRILSKRGTTSYDLKTNSLFVQDVPVKLKEVRELLARVDIPAKQILIEGRVVVADDSFGRTLGVKLGAQTSGRIGGTQFGLGGSSGSAQTLIGTAVPSGVVGNNVNLPLGGPSTLGVSLLNAGSNLILNLELDAMEQDKRGKIISSPRVITQNQRPAVILQGQQIPYQTVSQSGTQTSFQNAVLCLLVNPQILNNDDIILDVEITKDAPGEATAAGLRIDTKRVKTQVRVRNGETAILGGIFEQTLRDDTNKVPVLGDIPVFGHLFKNTSRRDEKNELLLFITPRVLPEGLAGIQ